MERGVQRWAVNISAWNPSHEEFNFCLSILPDHEHSAVTRFESSHQVFGASFLLQGVGWDEWLFSAGYWLPLICIGDAHKCRFVKFEDRKRALVSRMLQYMLVHAIFGIPYGEIVIQRTEEGKPYLANQLENCDFPNFNFNSSHHGDYVTIASEPLCLVGLDIMCHGLYEKRPATDFLKNFSSCFTSTEWLNIFSAGPKDEDILNQFYRYWCLKEAYIKAVGIGLGFELERLEFYYPGNQIWSDVAHLRIDGKQEKDWQFFLYQFDNRHWVCVARGHPSQAVSSYRKTLRQVEFDNKSYNHGLELPNIPFTLYEIDHLIPKTRKEEHANIRAGSR